MSIALWETTLSTCFSKTLRRSSMFCNSTEVVSFKSGTSTLNENIEMYNLGLVTKKYPMVPVSNPLFCARLLRYIDNYRYVKNINVQFFTH